MSRKAGFNGEPVFAASVASELAARESRWQAALAEAESALQSGDAQDAERRAKALTAIAKAVAEVAQWREQAMAALRVNETEQDGDAFRRELERRLNRYRRERGLDPVFAEDPEPI